MPVACLKFGTARDSHFNLKLVRVRDDMRKTPSLNVLGSLGRA